MNGKQVLIPQLQSVEPVLLRIEEAPAPYEEAGTFNDANLLYGRLQSYAHCSSYRPGGFAHYVQDGNVTRGWRLPDSETQGWVDASLGLPVLADTIVVRESGSATQAYNVQVYDGSAWQQLAAGTSLGAKAFHFKPMPVSSVRVEITTGGGGSIGEIEVYNTADPDRAFADGPSAALRQAFSGDRMALLLGSPLVLSKQGVEYVDPREYAVRPLPDSARYLPQTLMFLLQKAGGEGRWDKEANVFTGTCKGREVYLELAKVPQQTREQIVSVLMAFGSQIGRPCTVYPQAPLVLTFGDPLPAAEQSARLGELKELLGRGEGLLRFTRDTGVPRAIDAVVRPSELRIGTTMKWVGVRTGNMEEGTNIPAWFSYYRPRSVRTWYGFKTFYPYLKKPAELESLDDFERLKAALRSAPETSELVLWEKLLASDLHQSLQHEFDLYRKFGVEIVNETGSKEWPNDWTDNFYHWSVTYLATYYLAKYYDVAVHQYGNEPDYYLDQHSDEEIVLKLQLQGDAITSAIEDVNRLYGKQLVPQYAAPVLASDPRSRIARLMMRNLRTNYRGEAMDRDLVQFYNRHRYNNRARQNVLEVNQVQDMMLEESATGKALPQIFTEVNWATGRNWSQPTVTVTNDSPQLIHSMASIWGQMMATQHVYGVFLFKLNSDSPRFSNTVVQQFYRESDTEPARLNTKYEPGTDVGYVTKNAEILRLFAEGFSNQQDLLDSRVRCGDPHYQAYTSYKADEETYYLWTVQVNENADYTIKLDLSDLDVAAGAQVTIREVSAASFGEVVYSGRLPRNRTLTVTQPRASAWLVSVPKSRKATVRNYPAIADTTVKQGAQAEENFGSAPVLQVRRHSDAENNRITYLRFKIDGKNEDVDQAVLRLYGKRVSEYAYDDSYTIRIYSLVDDSWEELQLTAANAPGIYRTVSAVTPGTTTLEAPPVGHMSFSGKGGYSELDITNFVREHADRELTLVLIRELNWPGEDTDFAGVEIASREAGAEQAPRLQIRYRTK